jgi:hypothetical protein
MTSTHLSQQLATLHWLSEELGAVLEQWRTTPYPEVHRFLACTSSSKLAEIAGEACTTDVEPLEEDRRCA